MSREATLFFKDADYATSKGVIHHIREPDSTVRNIHASLKPGGKFIMWIYAKEDEAYLRMLNVMQTHHHSYP